MLPNAVPSRGIASGGHGGESIQFSIPNEKPSLEQATDSHQKRRKLHTASTTLAILPASQIACLTSRFHGK